MTVLWGMIDPIAPGAASMFLLIATSYWLAFGMLALALARRGSTRLALLLPVLALLPPAFVFAGIIWRDVLFATSWLLAAAIAFAVTESDARLRVACASTGACAVRLRRPVASERADRRADPRGVHCVADASVSRAYGDPVRPGDGRLFRAGAGGLLRRARRDAATSAAVDHGVRPRRHQPLRQTEPVSGRLERAARRTCC